MKEKKKVTRTASLRVARVVRDQDQDPTQIPGDPVRGPTGQVRDLAVARKVEHNHQNPQDSSKIQVPKGFEDSENIPFLGGTY